MHICIGKWYLFCLGLNNIKFVFFCLDTQSDDCSPIPCLNNETCIEQANFFNCTCAPDVVNKSSSNGKFKIRDISLSIQIFKFIMKYYHIPSVLPHNMDSVLFKNSFRITDKDIKFLKLPCNYKGPSFSVPPIFLFGPAKLNLKIFPLVSQLTHQNYVN